MALIPRIESSAIDISVLLNVHDEFAYLSRTLLSLAEAADFAADHGLICELVVVQDRPSSEVARWFGSYDFSSFATHKVTTVDCGSLGLARNAGVKICSGEYISTADADDLISFNWLHGMHRKLLQVGPAALVSPEFFLAFAENHHLVRYFDQSAISNLSYISYHPYGSRVMAHGSVFREQPYKDVRLTNGYAYEDWHFNAECLARGVPMHVAEGVVLYYRQRPNGLLQSASALSVRQIPPTRLFDPEVYRKACARDYLDFSEGEPRRVSAADVRAAFEGSPVCLAASAAANRIDPAVTLPALQAMPAFSNLNGDLTLGAAYYQVAGLLEGRRFSDVVLLPFLTTGGGEKYILNVLNVLSEELGRTFLILTGEGGVAHEWLDHLPSGSLFIDLFNSYEDLNAEGLDIITLRIIESVAPTATIHIKSSAYGVRFFSKFGHLLNGNQNVFYRFGDIFELHDGVVLERGDEFNFLSNKLADLDLVVSDNASLVRKDVERLGVGGDKWICLYTQCNSITETPKVAREEAEIRLLWASRLDQQKRPELLARIARVLEDQPGVMIDVRGRPVLDDFDVSTLRGLSNVRYGGPFASFRDLEPWRYDAFLYTSAYDGLPNVVLEAMGAGLPVIAPDLGGLSEAVVSGQTGLLIEPDPDDDILVSRYVDAVLKLLENPTQMRAMGEAARRLVEVRHSDAAFRARVRAVFEEPR